MTDEQKDAITKLVSAFVTDEYGDRFVQLWNGSALSDWLKHGTSDLDYGIIYALHEAPQEVQDALVEAFVTEARKSIRDVLTYRLYWSEGE